jgi:thioredoxin 1
MGVTEIARIEELEKVLSANSIVVLDASAEWCGPCKAIAPKIHELSQQYTTVKFLKFDVDESEELSVAYEITAMPTFIFFKDGSIVDRVQGADYKKIVKILNDLEQGSTNY